MSKSYDCIIIGSGAGGMTAALALALAGQKILICEKHNAPGGWTHSFSKEGYRFNTGVHYVGELEKGGSLRRIYEGLGISRDLHFLEMNPDGYDHFLIGTEKFDVPKGMQAYINRLQERFPREKEGIKRFFATIVAIDKMGSAFSRGKWSYVLGHLATMLWFRKTAGDLIGKYLKDPLLKAIVGAQVGISGLPPNRLAAAIYAGGMAHYFEGGYHPLGGGSAISKAYLKKIRELGGEIRLQTEVKRILIKDKKACGVELDSGEIIHAQHIVSNADPGLTYLKMVGPEHLGPKLIRKIRNSKYSISCISLFLAVEMDLKQMGLDSGNYWLYDDADIDNHYSLASTDYNVFNPPKGLFVTITTLKDPTKMHKGHHQLEVFTLSGYEAFRKWANTTLDRRGHEYEQLKEAITERLFDKLEVLIPGIRKGVVFANLATPLTNEHYVNAPLGNIYGIEKTSKQIGPGSFSVRSEVGNLFFCGASTISHGIGGTTQSGLLAAAALLDCKPSDLLRGEGPELSIFQAENTDAWPQWLRDKCRD